MPRKFVKAILGKLRKAERNPPPEPLAGAALDEIRKLTGMRSVLEHLDQANALPFRLQDVFKRPAKP